MNINLEITDEQVLGLEFVVESYNKEKSKSFVPSGSLDESGNFLNGASYIPISSEDYVKARVSDVLDSYTKSYQSYLASNTDNIQLYKDVIQNKDNPVVAFALRGLISAVNSVKSE